MKRCLVLLSLLFSTQSFAWSVDEIRRILNPQNNYYVILGVEQNASEEEIKTAFRKLLKTYHPDHYAHDPQKLMLVNKVMGQLNVSRNTLMDPSKRRIYNITMPKSPPPQSSTYTNNGKESAEARAARRAREFKEAAKARETRESWRVKEASDARWGNAKKWEPEDLKANPTSTYAKKAKQTYEKTARCGTGYFKHFVDVFE